ncbi:CAAD domain-containing protein [Synechococcus sp. RSCCF101]|uniref:CAAD domain-containing protein n=1 Tax=Synechococcus sp. RSCCF101 TaxID=2511069 RepID=UPI001782DFB7|nr:CAAD domain-containing protein [Synechococcus sp. RSCCF101]
MQSSPDPSSADQPAPQTTPAAEEPATPVEPSAQATPSPEPAPQLEDSAEPEAAPEPETAPSAILQSVEIPAAEPSSTGADTGSDGSTDGPDLKQFFEGVLSWWQEARIGERLVQAKQPVLLLLGAIGLLLAIRLYGAVVHLIDSIPVVSGLLELVGLLVALRFAATRLLKREDRQEVLGALASRWRTFRGQG